MATLTTWCCGAGPERHCPEQTRVRGCRHTECALIHDHLFTEHKVTVEMQ